MAFTTTCMTKGCQRTMEPYLDVNTNKVYCSDCNSEISNLTQFVKTQMKANKQFKKQSSKPFAIKCNLCGQSEQPLLFKNDVICGACKKPLANLSEPFKIMLKEKLKTANKDI